MSYPPPPSDPHDPPSADPWATSTGDAQAPQPQPRPGEYFQPGQAAVPPPVEFDPYPPTSQFPSSTQPGYQGYQQPGYAQPGPQPGYAPPGYGPPQPGYQQPYETPKPKRNNTPLIAVLIAVTLLLCAGGVTSVVLLVNRATEKAQETIGSVPTAPPDIDVPGLPTELPTDLPTLPTDLPDLPGNGGFGEEFEVEYEVTGDGPVSIVWVDAEKGPQQESDVSLPWRKTLTMQKPYFVSVTAVRADVEEGTIACSVKVDGEQVAEKEGTGRFTTASCSKTVS